MKDKELAVKICNIIGIKIQYMAQRWELDCYEYYKNTRYFYDFEEAMRWCSEEFQPVPRIPDLTSPHNFLALAELLHKCVSFKIMREKTLLRSILDSAYMLVTTKSSSLDAAQKRFMELCQEANWRY